MTRRPAKVLTQIYKGLRRGNEMIVKVTWGHTVDSPHRPSCLGAVAVVGKAGGLRTRRSGGSGSLSFTQLLRPPEGTPWASTVRWQSPGPLSSIVVRISTASGLSL